MRRHSPRPWWPRSSGGRGRRSRSRRRQSRRSTRGAVTVPPPEAFPGDFIPVPDRWRLMENFGVNERWYDAYSQSTLKGDRPDLRRGLVHQSERDLRHGVAALDAGAGGHPVRIARQQRRVRRHRAGVRQPDPDRQRLVDQGNTAFKPQDLEFRLTPAYNYNYALGQEDRFLDANPLDGQTRTDDFWVSRRPSSTTTSVTFPTASTSIRPCRHPAVLLRFPWLSLPGQRVGSSPVRHARQQPTSTISLGSE